MTAVVTILMFLVMVSLHEFGHFIVGRVLGFHILEYSIGFGPTILKSRKTETQYSLRALPLGGFCRFDGEDGDSDHPGAFYKQAVWKRMLVVVAGGLSNILLGFVLFLIIVPFISPVRTNVVDEVVEYSYSAESGMQPGDEIIGINGHSVSFYNEIALYTDDFVKNNEATIKVKRGKEKLTLTLKPTEDIIVYNYTENGVDVAESINGHDIVSHYDYSDDMPMDSEMIGKSETVTRYLIGFRPQLKDVTLANVWGIAWDETKFVVKLVYRSLWEMVTGKIGADQMSGPVGIVQEVHNEVHSGRYAPLNILNLVALLTINLGVFNLLPIPALDGGRFFFMLIELIRRRPIPPEKEGMVHAIGMLLLFALILFVSFNDIMRLIGN